MFEQAVLTVQDEARLAEAQKILAETFAADRVAMYLRKLKASKVRARDFEGALRRGLLGPVLAEDYRLLGDSDRGQVRELYLSMVERVSPELRAKFLTIYAYY